MPTRAPGPGPPRGRRRWAARTVVEGGEPGQGTLEDASGILLLQRHALAGGDGHEGVKETGRPLCQGCPRRLGVALRHAGLQLEHEVAHGLGGLAVAVGSVCGRLERVPLGCARPLVVDVGGHAHVPVGPGDDAGLSGDPLPPRDRDPHAGEVGHAHLAEDSHDVGAAIAGARRLEQPEHQPGQCALVDRAHARPVDADAGSAQVFVEQARVRRAGGIQHGDPVRGHPLEQAHHFAHDAAHLVVGVGCREDSCGGRLGRRLGGRLGRRLGGWLDDRSGFGRGPGWGSLGLAGIRCAGERAERGARTPVGAGHAREPDDDVDRSSLAEHLGERALGPGEVLGEVDHERAEVGGRDSAVADQGGRGGEEVGGVVPAAAQRVADLSVEADDVTRQAAGFADLVEDNLVDVAKLPRGQRQRPVCRGVCGNRLERAGLRVEPLADRCRGDRTGRRAAALAGEGGRGELFGQAGKCGDVDGRHAVGARGQAVGEIPARDDAGDVVGHDDGDRRHRVALLCLRNRVTKCVQSLTAVCRGAHLCCQTALLNPRL